MLTSMLAMVALCPTALAAPGAHLPYQGRLVDSAGRPLEGTHSVSVGLWDHPTDPIAASHRVYEESFTNIPFNGGYFAVVLGLLGGLDVDELGGRRWIEIQVDTDPALTPRQEIRGTPGVGSQLFGTWDVCDADNEGRLRFHGGVFEGCVSGSWALLGPMCPTTAFVPTPGTTVLTVPTGCTTATIDAWGGGGGGGGGTNVASNESGGNGGGAAFVSATIAVTSGEPLTVHVATGGGGGAARLTGSDGSSGAGGGYSGIFRGSTPVLIAAGGGGGGGGRGNGSRSVAFHAGGGGAPNGQTGEGHSSLPGGGTTTSGGSPQPAPQCSAGQPGIAGSSLQGGNGANEGDVGNGAAAGQPGGGRGAIARTSSGGAGGAGGGGLFGGAGGCYDTGNSAQRTGSGGGGGSSLIPAGGTALAGVRNVVGGAADPDYVAGVGVGGAGGGSTSAGATGGNGRVVIRYAP
jgi:hypothetical protein